MGPGDQLNGFNAPTSMSEGLPANPGWTAETVANAAALVAAGAEVMVPAKAR